MQEDDNAEGAVEGTITGRNQLVLTPATYKLVNEIKYGVDGNVIDVSTAKAARFVPESGKTYAFVYIKTAPDDTEDVVKYEALSFESFKTGQTKYRYDYKATTAYPVYVDDKDTEDTSDDVTTNYFDAQKDVKYFTESGGAYSRVEDPFIGQSVGNLYLDNQGSAIASGYAVSGVDYYYTVDNGQHYIKAHNVAYNAANSLTGLYKEGSTSGSYVEVETTETQPVTGTAYYYKDGEKFIYCVFLPMQVKDMFVLDEDKTHCVVATETTAVDGQTYFDKYIKNNGVYYTKVIKVQ